MTDADAPPAKPSRRLDQWLWFARLVKSRSLAARFCAEGAVVVNGAEARKASRPLRVGDAIIMPQGGLRRTLRVLALGMRRGPTAEARSLYEEIAAPVRLPDPAAGWTPLLADDAPDERHAAALESARSGYSPAAVSSAPSTRSAAK